MVAASWTAGLVVLLATFSSATAKPCRPGPGVCEKPYVRKEWRNLSNPQKEKYIKAVQCLMEKPSTAGMAAVRNRYEDFVATHIVQTEAVHFTGIFYPFHRLLLLEYEKALWECGWDRRLGQPFWDWTLDTESDAKFLSSPVFDKKLGFGGNGAFIPGNLSHPELPGHVGGPPFDLPDRSGGGCLEDGPFAGLKTQLGPLNDTEVKAERCIRRDFSPRSLARFGSRAQVDAAMQIGDYGTFERVTDSQTFHPAGHWATGGLYGTMTDTYASPGDPVFYLHHSNVDRAWWSWQQRDLGKRQREMDGPLFMFDYANALGGNATLDTPVWVGLAGQRVEFKAGELLHLQKGPLCYMYESIY
ncbi:hypothetical protein MCOR02_001961 [Pyricularia oryzae]|nr:hypothetical protein MCOR02_001961 [Pyricularia oryzae]KAI6311328.1 hypothetical protein MCOR34_006089 [Pyricularia oryzae]KAI6443943.1 hypothetical protein MCOR17_011289 [Pyricularia oryzae]KAI6508552.1 hypothetical protein MCOR13_002131 [Pyricularia oryzae]KAI6580188.1 hypothetical protein MCOR04_005818 [Pyricularia oryzae]